MVIGVFAELDRRKVRWALLRAPPVQVQSTGDVDVLVDVSDEPKVEATFRELGFVRLPRSGSHFIRYDASSDWWPWFHVVYELSFGRGRRLQTGTAEACLARRTTSPEPPRLAHDDAFWTLLLHSVLDKRRVVADHRNRLEALAAHDVAGGPLAGFVEGLCAAAPGAVSPATITGMVARGEWTAVEQALWALERNWTALHQPSRLRQLRQRGYRVAAAAWRATRRRGLTVALLGPDGAGKSTLAAGLAQTSRVPVRVMYMGLTGGRLKRIDRLKVPGVVFAGRALIIWERYLRSRLHRARGRLVVFDRYVLDAMVPHPLQLNRIERLSRWLDGYLCPPPDLVLILDAPGEVMHGRKGEYSPAMLEDWRRHFLALQQRLSHVEVIDATRDAEAVRIDATARIWRHYQARWNRPVSGRARERSG